MPPAAMKKMKRKKRERRSMNITGAAQSNHHVP
jgi:hypothetical protein